MATPPKETQLSVRVVNIGMLTLNSPHHTPHHTPTPTPTHTPHTPHTHHTHPTPHTPHTHQPHTTHTTYTHHPHHPHHTHHTTHPHPLFYTNSNVFERLLYARQQEEAWTYDSQFSGAEITHTHHTTPTYTHHITPHPLHTSHHPDHTHPPTSH
jgi:hypothetical protein